MNKPGTIDVSSQENMKYRFALLSKQTSTAHSVIVEKNIMNHISTALVSPRENLIVDRSSNDCLGYTVRGKQSIKFGQIDETRRNVFEKNQKVCKILSISASAVHKRVEKSVHFLECKTRGRKFMKKSHLSRHICTYKTSLHSKRPFSCEDCGKHFSQKTHLSNHISGVHMNQRHFICGHCQKAFGRKQELTRHVNVVHTKDPKYMRRFMCVECNKGFPFKKNLTQHLVTHETSLQERKSFGCNKCGLRFTQSSALYRHQRTIHNKEKSYSCDVCKKGFSQKQQLISHFSQRQSCPMFPSTVLHSY